MKNAVIVVVVIATITGLVVYKKRSGDGETSGSCPCSMMQPAETNHTETGTTSGE
ncbi:MAG: hypothetical protein HKP10_04740 [Kiritimatiellales bacterium]|nr:hypothetical protein [Pontiella sp.]NNJ70579.1 hypothetical protein [Kiritimatiellales bacterium]